MESSFMAAGPTNSHNSRCGAKHKLSISSWINFLRAIGGGLASTPKSPSNLIAADRVRCSLIYLTQLMICFMRAATAPREQSLCAKTSCEITAACRPCGCSVIIVRLAVDQLFGESSIKMSFVAWNFSVPGTVALGIPPLFG